MKRLLLLAQVATLCFCWFLTLSPAVQADEGHPVAIRFWPEGGVSIETMWNFHIGVRIDQQKVKLPQALDVEFHQSEKKQSEGSPTKVHVWSDENQSFILDRKPNKKAPVWMAADESEDPSSNAVRVSQIQLQFQNQSQSLTRFEVDGVSIIELNPTQNDWPAFFRNNKEVFDQLKPIDAVVLSGGMASEDGLNAIREMTNAKTILLGPGVDVSDEESIGQNVGHNTWAISTNDRKNAKPVVARLTDESWVMNDELLDYFEKKRASSRRSQAEFAKLSVAQLNFQPSNGTHTPRWNTEHMMARELLYFSQFFNGVDPSVPVMNINPRQMPDDYKFAHPDWDGEEEARQTERVQAFTWRFAYLLDGLDMDKRPKGSRNWTPRGLLRQMERHYDEHTANVLKKMELPEWPKD